ncbi:MAG: hypothetical protein QOJ84_4023 [Bradyrhizobium sp.]|jgi:hypothetical protein|nr:hypothetical protein [Bradyrhizobium sp.]
MVNKSVAVSAATQVAVASPAAMDEIRRTIHELLALSDAGRIVDLAVEMGTKLEQTEDSPDKSAFQLALNGAACFGAGLRAAQQTDFAGAADNLRTAVENFNAVDIVDARSIAYAFLCYVDGTRNALLLNLDRARELWNEAERHLKEEGGLQEKYRFLLEQFKPDQLYISAVGAIARQDYDAARLLLEEASQAASGFADKHLSPEDPGYRFYKGLGQFYAAYYNFADSTRDFMSCGYDRLIDRRIELTQVAKEAKSLLVLESYPNEIRRRVGVLAAAINLLQEILIDFSAIMKDVMLANFSRDTASLLELRLKIAEVRKLVSGLGPPGAAMLGQCELLARQADNVERLTRPTVKDFGLFSGLVAMIAFVPLLIVTSWTFNHFEWGTPPIAFMWLNVGVACLVGFGAGALKLLPAFMGGKPKD